MSPQILENERAREERPKKLLVRFLCFIPFLKKNASLGMYSDYIIANFYNNIM